ncbi:MAG: hypothetical protein ABIL62_09360 [Planctomycetota bacterium]
MKRISLLTIVMLTVASGVAKAQSSGYSSFRYRTRWSPYAFSHKRSGLISGYLRYSPYGFNHKNPSGLIDEDFYYTPYAFSHKHSGLVYDSYSRSYSSYYAPYYRIQRAPVVVVHSVHQPPCAHSYKYSQPSNEANNSYQEKLIARRQRINQARDSRKQINMAKENDGKEIIYRYLKSRNIDDFEMTGILKITNKTVNVNFLLRDKNIIITYWDLDEVQSLLQQPGYKRNYYERHEQQWKNLCTKYIQTGGKVYLITSADAKEILAKLMLCPELNDG